VGRLRSTARAGTGSRAAGAARSPSTEA
jgi:hypothetical protein